MEARMLLWAYLIFAAWSGVHFFRRRGVFGARFLVGVTGVGAVSGAGLYWPSYRPVAFWAATAGFLVFLLLPGVLVGIARRLAGTGRFRAAHRLLSAALLTAPAGFLRSERDLYEAAAHEEGDVARAMAERVKARVAAAGGSGPAPVSLLLAIAVVLVHIVVTMVGDSRSAFTLLELGANHLPLVRDGEWFRLMTAMFLHSGLLHLVLNATAIWIVGRWVEPDLGPGRTWIVFVVGGLVGNVASLIASAQADVPLPSVGASGGALALLGAVIPLTLRRERSPERASRLQTTGLIVAATLFLGFVEPVIDDGAHLGGLLSGAALGLLFTRHRLPTFGVRVAAIAMLGVVLTAVGLDFVSVRRWRTTKTLEAREFVVEYPAFLRATPAEGGWAFSLPPLAEAHLSVIAESDRLTVPPQFHPIDAPEGWAAVRGCLESTNGAEWEYIFRRRHEESGRLAHLQFYQRAEDPLLLERIVTPVVLAFRFR